MQQFRESKSPLLLRPDDWLNYEKHLPGNLVITHICFALVLVLLICNLLIH